MPQTAVQFIWKLEFERKARYLFKFAVFKRKRACGRRYDTQFVEQPPILLLHTIIYACIHYEPNGISMNYVYLKTNKKKTRHTFTSPLFCTNSQSMSFCGTRLQRNRATHTHIPTTIRICTRNTYESQAIESTKALVIDWNQFFNIPKRICRVILKFSLGTGIRFIFFFFVYSPHSSLNFVECVLEANANNASITCGEYGCSNNSKRKVSSIVHSLSVNIAKW